MLNPSGDSPEIVALALLERIARSEGRQFDIKPDAGMKTADRLWILSTYADCLAIVRGNNAKLLSRETAHAVSAIAERQATPALLAEESLETDVAPDLLDHETPTSEDLH